MRPHRCLRYESGSSRLHNPSDICALRLVGEPILCELLDCYPTTCASSPKAFGGRFERRLARRVEEALVAVPHGMAQWGSRFFLFLFNVLDCNSSALALEHARTTQKHAPLAHETVLLYLPVDGLHHTDSITVTFFQTVLWHERLDIS